MLSFDDIREIRSALTAVEWIAPELQNNITRQTKSGAAYRDGGKSNSTPLVFDDRASTAATDLRIVLSEWSSTVQDEWTGYDREPVPQDAVSLAAFIQARIMGLVPYDEAKDDILGSVSRSKAVVDSPATTIYLGVCSCGTRLYGDPESTYMVCWACGTTYTVALLRQANQTRGENYLVTANDAARYIGDISGIMLTARRIRAWHRQGKLDHRGCTCSAPERPCGTALSPTGEFRFRLGDIVRLAGTSVHLKAKVPEVR